MRHVTLQVPTAQELLVRIRDPSRFRPRAVARSLPELRALEGGGFEIQLTSDDRWRKVHAMIVAIHGALREDPVADVDRLVPLVVPHLPRPDVRVAEQVVRNFLLALWRSGHLEIPFEEPPAVFAGRYDRVRELGRGGMGVAHLCRDRDTGRLVVVKHAWGWTKPIEKAEATNRKEAAILRMLDHPRIPPLVDSFEVDGILHMVRLFAPGKEITKGTPRPWDLSFQERVLLVRGIAEAIAHVHERGFLYLDLKPGNVIVGSLAEGPMLLDLGVCQPMTGDSTRLRGIVGSRGFVAPELKTLEATTRVDVFSLGRTWYHLASGRKPRAGRTWSEYEARLVSAGAPEEERALIARLTAADPLQRPADMREVLALLP